MIQQATDVSQSKAPLILGASGVIAFALVAGLVAGYFVKESPLKPDAKLQIALEAFRSGNDATALSLLTPLANEGNAKAQYWLADIYEDDDQGVKSDVAKAHALLEKSAAQGFVPAERHLGQLYLRAPQRSRISARLKAGCTKPRLPATIGRKSSLAIFTPWGWAYLRTRDRPTAGTKTQRFMETVGRTHARQPAQAYVSDGDRQGRANRQRNRGKHQTRQVMNPVVILGRRAFATGPNLSECERSFPREQVPPGALPIASRMITRSGSARMRPAGRDNGNMLIENQGSELT